MGIDFSRLDRAGIDSVMFAVRKLLDECEGREFHLKPKTFVRYIRGKDPHTRDDFNGTKLTMAEKRSYKRQLARVLKYWNKYELSGEWDVEESNGKSFKLVFRRDSL